MKQSDIFTVVLVASIGTIAAFIVVNMILKVPDSEAVKTIDVIQSGLAAPDPEMYNIDAINPTVEVYVGDCQDADQNGILDSAEIEACQEANRGGN
ncbi:hypothetical protein IJH97_02635 [Candidatus Saccharibacteria bacterium]|nr:hypothetical protein [Candidatus Saccharibacteria bacterium]